MNNKETIKILSTLYVAYPRTFKDISDDEKKATISLWQAQFKDEPLYVVEKALNNIISKSRFSPTIADLKAEIRAIKENASNLYRRHLMATVGITVLNMDILTGKKIKETILDGEPLDDETLQECKKILGK